MTDEPPLQRSLRVLKLIGEHGPVRLVDMAPLSSISKTALHRICTQLEQEGWVRKRVSDKAYVLSYRMDDFFAQARFSSFLADQYQGLFETIKSEDRYALTLSALVATSQFSVIEGTLLPALWEHDMSFLFSPAAVAVQAVMVPTERVAALTRYLKTASPEEVATVRSGDHGRRVLKAAQDGYVLDPDIPSLHLGLHDSTAGYFAASLEPLATSKRAKAAFIANVDTIRDDMVQRFATTANSLSGTLN